MFNNPQDGQQYIAGLKAQLAPMESRMNELKNTPIVVRRRKGLEAEYISLQNSVKQLKEKIKQARNRYEEFMAMEEAQGVTSRLGDSMSKGLKVGLVVSGVVLIGVVVGAIIIKKVRK